MTPELIHVTHRTAPIDMAPDDFRALGHQLVDAIADWLRDDADRPRHRKASRSPKSGACSRATARFPSTARSRRDVLEDATTLLFEHSLFNGHPRFFGYITSSPAPIGALGDLLAAPINQNVGAFTLSPLATEIEAQTVRWIAELIGYPAGGDGLLVSGGNMANFVCFLAARAAKATWDVRTQGPARTSRGCAPTPRPRRTRGSRRRPTCSGLGTDAIRWIPVDGEQRMNVAALEAQIDRGRRARAICRFSSSAPPDR